MKAFYLIINKYIWYLYIIKIYHLKICISVYKTVTITDIESRHSFRYLTNSLYTHSALAD